jgi:hypothetical protein
MREKRTEMLTKCWSENLKGRRLEEAERILKWNLK